MPSLEIGGGYSISLADASPAVLNLPMAESAAIVDRLHLPSRFFTDISAAEGSRILQASGFGELALPEENGQLYLEEAHVPMLDEIEKHFKDRLPGLSSFANRYPMPGSETSIQLLLAEWVGGKEMAELGVIEGDYFGYAKHAKTAGLGDDQIFTVRSLEEAGPPVKGRVWFISNPSAVNGNWLDDKALQDFIEAGHEVVLDYAYGGLAKHAHSIDVSAENIKALLISPSKSHGVFHFRFTGLTFTRQESKSLDETPWFKSTANAAVTMVLYNELGLDTIPAAYEARQLEACALIGNLIGKEVVASDTILIATTDEPLPPEFAEYSFMTLPSGTTRFRLPTIMEKLERAAA